MVGLGSANLFPLIFSIAVEKMPDRANEVSGLMIMAVSGGAFLPPIMGLVSTFVGITASFLVLVAAMIYLVSAGFILQKNNTLIDEKGKTAENHWMISVRSGLP